MEWIIPVAVAIIVILIIVKNIQGISPVFNSYLTKNSLSIIDCYLYYIQNDFSLQPLWQSNKLLLLSPQNVHYLSFRFCTFSK